MRRKITFNYNQLALPFGELGERTAKSISYEDRERFFWFLTAMSLGALLVYVYAINASAHNIAIRQNLERELSEERVELSTLEFQAIALKNSVTLEVAEAHGFREVSEPLYVSRGAGTPSLTLNTVTR